MASQHRLFDQAPAVILIGVDDKRKNHASWFNESEVEQATRAAELMGMATIAVDGDELSTLASRLPHGKIFETGRAFVPFVKGELFTKLTAHLPQPIDLAALRASASGNDPSLAPKAAPTLPKDWSTIVVGDLVLATEGGDEGWFEAVVERVTGLMFTLRWRDWPDLPVFVRTVDTIALLPQPKPSKAN